MLNIFGQRSGTTSRRCRRHHWSLNLVPPRAARCEVDHRRSSRHRLLRNFAQMFKGSNRVKPKELASLFKPVLDHRPAPIFSQASGKAGGFLARNWNAGTPTDELSQKSFDMHEEPESCIRKTSHF